MYRIKETAVDLPTFISFIRKITEGYFYFSYFIYSDVLLYYAPEEKRCNIIKLKRNQTYLEMFRVQNRICFELDLRASESIRFTIR